MKMLKWFPGFCAAVLCCVFSVSAQKIQLKADSLHIQIGDHLKVIAQIDLPDRSGFQWITNGEQIGTAELVEWQKADTQNVAQGLKITQPLLVSAYDSGLFILGPMAAVYNGDTLVSETLLLEVSTLEVDTSAPIKPIKAPLEVPYSFEEMLPYILGAILLLALIAAIWWYLKKRKKKEIAPEVRKLPKDPPHVWAEKELKKLDSEKLWQKDEVKAYYSRLTDILRLYLEYQYQLPAMENTTEEIRKQVMMVQIPVTESQRLLGILELADRVKFAKGRPGPEQFTKSMQDAFLFVSATIPVEQPKPGKN